MCRCAFQILLTTAILALYRPAMSSEQSAEPDVPFQWLAGSGETAGVKYATQRLQPLSLNDAGGPAVEIVQEEVKINGDATRITRLAYMTSVNGERQLTEKVVEEIRKMPGDRVRAVRTTYKKDLNGSFHSVEEEIQDMAPSGANSYHITKTVRMPGFSGALVEKERIQQIERRKGDNAVEIDRTRYMPGINGGWIAAERRVSQNILGKDQTQTEEQVYQNSVNNELSLDRQIKTAGWKDAGGQHWQSETFTRSLEGAFRLDNRVTMLRTPLKDGRQVTTEILEKPNLATPGRGLELVRKIVENLQVLGPNETKRQLEVLEPNLNGGMRQVQSRQSIEAK